MVYVKIKCVRKHKILNRIQRTPIHTSLRRRVHHYDKLFAHPSNWHSISVATLFSYQSLLGVGARAPICRDIPPSNRNLFMKIYCIRHYRTRILFLWERPRGTKSPYSIPFLHTSHTWVSSRGIHGFCLNTWIAFGTRVRFLLVWIGKVFLISLAGEFTSHHILRESVQCIR